MFVSPGAVAFKLGGIVVYWYGICMSCAILLGLFVSGKVAKNFYPKVDMDKFYDLSFYLILGGIIGARLYYVLFDWSYFGHNLAAIPKLWTGGLSIHGAILGGFIAGALYVWKNRLDLWMYADVMTFGLCMGQIVGRLGNFFNSEAFGVPTNLPWKLFIPIANRPEKYIGFEYFHPTFLYEMILNSIIFGLLYYVVKNRKSQNYGVIFFAYLILYSIARILVESLRIDSVFDFYGVPIAVWASGILIFTGFLGLFLKNMSASRKGKRSTAKKPSP